MRNKGTLYTYNCNMLDRKTKIIFNILFIWIQRNVVASPSPVTCQTFRPVNADCHVLCNFNQKIADLKLNFFVKFSAKESDKEVTIMTCSWLEKIENITCDIRPGCNYTFVNSEMTVVNVSLSTITQMGGHITCILDPSPDTKFEPCVIWPAVPCKNSSQDKGIETERIGTSDYTETSIKQCEGFIGTVIACVSALITESIFVVYAIFRLKRRFTEMEKAKQDATPPLLLPTTPFNTCEEDPINVHYL